MLCCLRAQVTLLIKKVIESYYLLTHHYLACSKALSGQIAILANLDPKKFLDAADNATANLKTTGEEEEHESSAYDHPQVASSKLRRLRAQVSALEPPLMLVEEFRNIVDMLQEIQETIDEAENSEEGVHQMAELKAEISAKVAQAAGNGEAEGFGAATTASAGQVVTSQGFDAPSLGFASVANAAATATQPVMMVRKKKKRDAAEAKIRAHEDGRKQPKSE